MDYGNRHWHSGTLVVCGTCEYWDPDDGCIYTCTNRMSPYWGSDTGPHEGCEFWHEYNT